MGKEHDATDNIGEPGKFREVWPEEQAGTVVENMNAIVPWSDFEGLIEAHYPKAGNDRQPVGLSIMLRVYLLQQWFNLSDTGVEEALDESLVLRRFAGADLGHAPTPDEATVLRFRHALEEHEFPWRTSSPKTRP